MLDRTSAHPMDHDSDSDSDGDLQPHEHYSHEALAHLAFKDHIAPLYLPPPKKIKMNTTNIFKPSETMRERVQRVQSKFSAAQLLCLRMEFNAFDADGSNTIDQMELRAIIDSLGGHHIKDAELKNLMDAIDEDSSGEVDWIEYLDMMLALRDGTADKSVADFLTRHPIVLLVHPDKQPASYLTNMLYRAAKESNIDIHVVVVHGSQEALKFLKHLPPGRKVSMMLSMYEMYPYDGAKMFKYMKRNMFWTPPLYFLTDSDVTAQLHRPGGCEKILLMLNIEQHEIMLMVIRHCATKKKPNKNLMSAHMRGLDHAHTDVRHEDDEVHRVHKKDRIGNRGIAFKPSRPRDKTLFAFASSSRWCGAFENVSPAVFTKVLGKCGGEAPQLIPVSPRGTVGSIHCASTFLSGGGRGYSGRKGKNTTPVPPTDISFTNCTANGGTGTPKFNLTKHLEDMSMSLPPMLPKLNSPRPTLSDLKRVMSPRIEEKKKKEEEAQPATVDEIFTPRRRHQVQRVI